MKTIEGDGATSIHLICPIKRRQVGSVLHYMTLDVMMVIYCCSFEPPKNMADGTVVSDGLNADLCSRARNHTGFHRFTEIGQIFHNIYIFSKNFKLSKLKSGEWFGQSLISCLNNSETQEMGLWGVKIQNITRGNIPPDLPRIRNRSVFILDPRQEGFKRSSGLCS